MERIPINGCAIYLLLNNDYQKYAKYILAIAYIKKDLFVELTGKILRTFGSAQPMAGLRSRGAKKAASSGFNEVDGEGS